MKTLEQRVEDLEVAVQSLGHPQVSASGHDGHKGFIAWLEERLHLKSESPAPAAPEPISAIGANQETPQPAPSLEPTPVP